MTDETITKLGEISEKLNSLIEAVEAMQKVQRGTTETMSMLTEELVKLQKIVQDAVK